jgi:hypothetical protein
MANDATYLRKMLEERGKLTMYGDGLAGGLVLKSENAILIVGDVGKGARITGEDKVFVVGNVEEGAQIEARDSVVVTGKSKGHLYARSADRSEDFSIVIDFNANEIKKQVIILGNEEPQGEQALHGAMEWLGANYPIKKPRSLARKFGIAAGVAVGATIGALGFANLGSLAHSPAEDVQLIFNAMAQHPVWTGLAAYAGFVLADMGRPNVVPLGLRDQRVPLPALPPPVGKLPKPQEPPLI